MVINVTKCNSHTCNFCITKMPTRLLNKLYRKRQNFFVFFILSSYFRKIRPITLSDPGEVSRIFQQKLQVHVNLVTFGKADVKVLHIVEKCIIVPRW